MKLHPVTGKKVPDETARVEVDGYVNPRAAKWPKADFIVGNPPFIGNKRMCGGLGIGYVDAVRKTYWTVPRSVDADVHETEALRSNVGLACPGDQLSGQGVVVEINTASMFSAKDQSMLKRYLTGSELNNRPKDQSVIDTPWSVRNRAEG